ncbi:disease resistance protein TAO1-like [Cryptomeria japonica]|uniref:disease resistance protein TAO1-like n=1 Tax=Cryptomeria japonica TaxID=3369 RepID=UPI0027DAA0C0|nr:disease resistance protein TAO1-like [Cryptomeria japonica]
MGYNKALKTIPNSLGKLSQLKKLKLCSYRSLTSLPDTVDNLVRLKELGLGNCIDLKSLPDTLGNLAKIEELNLYECKGLRILPNTIGGLAQLQENAQNLCTGSLRIWRSREDDQSGYIRRASDSSDILVPVFSKRFETMNRWLRDIEAIDSSKGLIIPFFPDGDSVVLSFCESCYVC